MRTLTFSLRSLLVGIVYVAVGCTALAKRSELWTSIVVTGTVATLLLAGIACVFARRKTRAFAGGFTIAGVAYLGAVYAPGIGERFAPHLATTKLLDWATLQLHGDAGVASTIAFSPDGRVLAGAYNGTVRLWNVATAQPLAMPAFLFQEIGHCLWALLLGCLGGMLAVACHARRERADEA
jgi:WD40 repeat protein